LLVEQIKLDVQSAQAILRGVELPKSASDG
jgi:hypothetical protein